MPAARARGRHARRGRTLEALDLLVRSAKVRYVGVSNFAAWQVATYFGLAERHD